MLKLKKRYRDYREAHDSPNKYIHTLTFYQVLAAKLIFLVCFEVSFIKVIFKEKLKICI